MDDKNFEHDLNEKIAKIRRLFESLPRFVRSLQHEEPCAADTSSLSSLNVNKVTPKTDYGDLLQSERPSLSAQNSFATIPQSSSASNTARSKKKKRTRKTTDPLRPTKKRSFGVDIGQGINTIKFIKENCCPHTEYHRSRLMNIFEKSMPTLKTDKSMENVYRQLPFSQESSRSYVCNKMEQEKKAGESALHREQSVLFAESQESIYRVRYKDCAIDLPNDYGIDELQSLFVPYNFGEY